MTNLPTVNSQPQTGALKSTNKKNDFTTYGESEAAVKSEATDAVDSSPNKSGKPSYPPNDGNDTKSDQKSDVQSGWLEIVQQSLKSYADAGGSLRVGNSERGALIQLVGVEYKNGKLVMKDG